MTALTCALLLVAGGVDRLHKVTLHGLSFKAPVEWSKSTPDEASLQWDEPESGASMSVTVLPLDPQRPAKTCLQQMVDAVGREGFVPLSLGAQPASKKAVTDELVEASTVSLPDGGVEEVTRPTGDKVTSTTVLGCNGRIKWVMTWSAKTREGVRFGPILQRVLESFSYGK